MCARNKTTTTFVTLFSPVSQAVVSVYSLNHVRPEQNNDDICNLLFSRISQAVVSVYSLNHVRPEPLERGQFTLWRALSVPSVLLAAFAVFCASIAIGGMQASIYRDCVTRWW
jgi:hypothetical protein